MKYYCLDQFKTLSLQSTNTGNVLISPCCASTQSIADSNTFNFTTNKFLTDIRNDTLNDIPAPACNRCWRTEETSTTSRRLLLRNNDTTNTSTELRRVDITTQNICNLACIGCTPGSSSTWEKELGITDRDYSYEDKIKIFLNLDHSKITHIHFTGGEPLMTSEHSKILEIYSRTVPLSQLYVSYNTNVTFFPNQDVINMWKQLRSLHLTFSIDATGSQAELLRWPCKWDQVSETLEKFSQLRKEIPHLNTNFIACVSNYNTLELTNIKKLSDEFGPSHPLQLQLNNDIRSGPEMIPDNLFDATVDLLSNDAVFDEIVARIKIRPDELTVKHNWANSVKYLDSLDIKRNTNWRDTLKIGQYVN